MRIWNSTAGWRIKTVRAEWLAIGLLFALQTAQAAPPNAENEPELEMLEFLGAWETSEGKWVSPFELMEGMQDSYSQETGLEPAQSGGAGDCGAGGHDCMPGIKTSQPDPDDQSQGQDP